MSGWRAYNLKMRFIGVISADARLKRLNNEGSKRRHGL